MTIFLIFFFIPLFLFVGVLSVIDEFEKTSPENRVHTGSRGGRYRIVNGRKRYDVG